MLKRVEVFLRRATIALLQMEKYVVEEVLQEAP